MTMKFEQVSSLLGQTVECPRWGKLAWNIPQSQPLLERSGRLIIEWRMGGSYLRDTIDAARLMEYVTNGFIRVKGGVTEREA